MDHVNAYIHALFSLPDMARQITFHRVEEEKEASYAQSKRPFASPIMQAANLTSLYSHQVEATDLVRAGRDIILTTPTASGKTLAYNLPVLEAYARDPEIHALYLFPLKALAQDQCQGFERLAQALEAAHPRIKAPTAAIYDGDTSDYARRKLRNNPPTVLITNPEMLHLGILPYHHNWTTFLASLAFVVVDEAHTYRGVLGSHIANLLRRLDRICQRYNARPAHILSTATVGNPEELGQNLLGTDATLTAITASGAPQGKRHFVFIDPDDSPSTMAIRLLQEALSRNLRTIVYCRSRRMTELISIWAMEKSGHYKNKISAYRAGFLPEERRDIERRMGSGDLLAVVSTSALELGIDIGSLDVCILVGYPGSIMSTLQRGGRVGRKGQESAVLLVAGEDALDQFFIHNPQEFFQRPPENAVINPDNPVILARHLECAAAEASLQQNEVWLQRPASRQALAMLEKEGLVLLNAEGTSWIAARKRPQRHVNMRGSGASFHIQDPEGTVIGIVDAHQAFRETHPGAVYLHRGHSYTIEQLDLGAKVARAVPQNVKWHTRVRTNKTTEILEEYAKSQAFAAPVAFGRLRVTEQITGYERRLNGSMRLMDVQPLDLPPQIFETEGFWFLIPDRFRLAVEDELLHFMGSIHALEHVAIGLMPLLVMADRNDFGGISIPMHAQLGSPAVFVYDGLPGGAGLSRSAFPHLTDLFVAMYRTLESCTCETGCPSCTHSPKCGSGNRPIDKAGALFLLSRLMEADPQEERTTLPTLSSIPSPRLVLPKVEENPPESVWRPFSAPQGNASASSAPTFQPTPTPSSGPVMVFDVETRRSAAEVGGWHLAERMGVSIAVLWDGCQYQSFTQDELPQMFALMRQAGLVVGFNSLRFDYKVLQPFADFDLFSLPSLDLLDVIKKRLNYRVSLDNLGNATFNSPKTADGLQALAWWKEGKVEEISAYCQSDVALTRQLYEFGKQEGYILFTNKAGQKVRIPVEW